MTTRTMKGQVENQGVTADAAALPGTAVANAFTPGPWRWEVNRKYRTVNLCGGPPKRGFGRYDLTVLSFRRWGMNGAAPVFWAWEGWAGNPQRADELAVAVEGREHHADWFADIGHPDAHLIAAAPELYGALEIAQVRECGSWCDPSANEHTSYCKAQRALLRKARGEVQP